MSSIKKNFEEVRQELEGYNPRIIAVTKYVDESKIIEAYNSGLRDFGENKVQDALEKIEKLPDEIKKNSNWHLIGHLQSNKVRKAVGKFDYIHSIDSLDIAKSISRIAQEYGVEQKVLVQVNISNEESKFGFTLEKTKEVFGEITTLDGIKVVGLMSMAPYTFDEVLLKTLFTGIKELKNYLQEACKIDLNELSMGMSNDYKIAVQSGSTMIRLGQRLFK